MYVLIGPFASLVDRSAATIWLAASFESIDTVFFESAYGLCSASNMLESMSHMMATTASLAAKIGGRWTENLVQDNEVTHCQGMVLKSESLPIYNFTFGFTSAIESKERSQVDRHNMLQEKSQIMDKIALR